MTFPLRRRLDITGWILSVALAFVFLCFGVFKFTEPLNWIGWIPSWMDGLLGMPKESWLGIIGAAEIVTGVGLLVPVRIVRRIAAAVVVVQLTGVLTQTGWNDLAVRDIGLLISAVALWVLLARE